MKIVILKLCLLLAMAIVAERLIPFQGGFSFPEVLDLYSAPRIIKALAYFDGIHYLNLARNGYYDFGHAFFPLFPLVVTVVGKVLGGNYLLAGLLISQVCLVGTLMMLPRLVEAWDKKVSAKWVVLFLLAFPTAFFLQTVYSESLFLLLVVLTLYFGLKGKLWKAGVFSVLAALTRVTGVLLVIPLAFLVFEPGVKIQWRDKLVCLLPIVGLGIYMAYLHFTVGDALAFFHSQSAFGAGRSANFVLLPQVYFRYLKILLTAEWNFAYFRSVLEVALATVGLGLTAWETWREYRAKRWQSVGINLFFLTSLVVPTLTGTFLSMPRFVLLALPMYLVLARLKSRGVKVGLVAVFVVLQIVLFGYFSQGYFVS